jgi:hypothetical protein
VGQISFWSVGEIGFWSVGEIGFWSVGEIGFWSVGEIGFWSVIISLIFWERNVNTINKNTKVSSHQQ